MALPKAPPRIRGDTPPPLRLEFHSTEERLLEEIRKRAPAFGSIDLRLVFQNDRLIDVVFITGEERVRLE